MKTLGRAPALLGVANTLCVRTICTRLSLRVPFQPRTRMSGFPRPRSSAAMAVASSPSNAKFSSGKRLCPNELSTPSVPSISCGRPSTGTHSVVVGALDALVQRPSML